MSQPQECDAQPTGGRVAGRVFRTFPPSMMPLEQRGWNVRVVNLDLTMRRLRDERQTGHVRAGEPPAAAAPPLPAARRQIEEAATPARAEE